MVPLPSPFASLLDARTWRKAQILLTGGAAHALLPGLPNAVCAAPPATRPGAGGRRGPALRDPTGYRDSQALCCTHSDWAPTATT